MFTTRMPDNLNSNTLGIKHSRVYSLKDTHCSYGLYGIKLEHAQKQSGTFYNIVRFTGQRTYVRKKPFCLMVEALKYYHK